MIVNFVVCRIMSHLPYILTHTRYYQYENKPNNNGPPKGDKPHRTRKVKGSDIISWTTLITVLVVIDSIWFIHRMARTYSTAKMVLYGCPAYIDCKKMSGS